MRLAKPLRLLPAVALLLPGLAVSAASPVQAADTAFPFKDESVTLVDRPGWSADLVTRPDGSSARVSSTANSTVAQEYGLTTGDQAAVSDALRRSWVEDQPYAALSERSGTLRGADSAALGYLDSDTSLDAAYLVKGAAGAQDSVVVTASQQYGFPVRGSVSVDPGALSITTTERGGGQPAYVWVRYADHLAAVRVRELPNDGIDLEPVTVTTGETGTFLDLHHHGTWLDQGRTLDEPVATRQTSFALLIDKGGAQDTLRAVMTKVVGHTDASAGRPGTVSIAPIYSWSADTMTTPTGRSWLPGSGRVRYTWPDKDGVANGGFDDVVSYSLVMSARSADASGGEQKNSLYAVTRMSDRPELWQAGTDDGTRCGNDTALEVDVAHQHEQTVIGCASVDQNGNADRLVQNVARASGAGTLGWGVQHSNPVNGEDRLGALHPRVVFPCTALLTQASSGCSTTAGSAGNAAMETTLGGDGDVNINRPELLDDYSNVYRTSDAWLDVKAPTNAATAGRFQWTPLSARGTVTPSSPLLVTPLPLQRNRVEVRIADDQTPVRTQSEPIPVAFLAAPPQVAGLGQQGEAPEFAATSSSGQGSTTSSSSRIGVHVGAEFEDPTGANGKSLEISLESEVSDESSLERTITTAQAYRGLVDDDVVVYRTIPSLQWRGTVIGSTTGVGFDTQVSVNLPTDGTVTSAASVTSLAKKFPALYGSEGQLRPTLDQVFGHTVGDPGSYLQYAADAEGGQGAQVDAYCDGSLSSGGDRQLRSFDTLVPGNPYLAKYEVPRQPDILVSDRHDVQTGTANAEGATFGIENSQTNSRVQSTSLDLDASYKQGFFKIGVTGGHTWGEGWTSTLSDGAEFASFVGNIPSDDPSVADETYSWRSFLCQKTVSDATGAPLTAWVLDYTVDDYAGSGGLAAVEGLRADGPVDSAETDPAATVLQWTKDAGTVKSYDWRVEAIGATDTRSGRIAFATPKQANQTDTASHAVPVGGDPLRPGQLYRWKTVATDFVGGRTDTDWQYFVTRKGPTGPGAVADRFSATEDQAAVLDVLANDERPTSGGVTLAIADPPVIGTATVVDGKVRYVPRRNQCGVDTFDYTATDADGRSSTGTVILRVACVNDKPVAVDDRYRMRGGEQDLEVPAPGILGNDRDADRDDLAPRVVSKPDGVRVALEDSGELELTLLRGAPRGSFTLRYRACDEESCSGVATVTIRR